MMKQNRGFTLIEVMLVVGILAVIASIAIPNFTGYLLKSRRADAKTALMALQSAQEKYRANCALYAATLIDEDGDGINDSDCNLQNDGTYQLEFDTSSAEGWYTISVNNATAVAYTATATTVAGERQAGDADCKKLILTVNAANPNGSRTSEDNAGNDSTAKNCW